MTIIRQFTAAAIGAALITGAFAAMPSQALAKPFKHYGKVYHTGYYHHHRRGYRPGYVGAGLVGGLALGALAASAATAAPVYATDCYTVRRRFYDDYGNMYVRRVNVCD
jgi:hypothetical protein